MSTQRKIDSARANGAKSHGPITEEGRKTSSMNALKHGITARTVVLSNENDAEYTALLDSYVQDLHPTGPVEMDLVLEMVNAKWRQRRLYNIETGLFEQQMDEQKAEIDRDYKSYDEIFEHVYALRTLAYSPSLQMLNRMASRLDRIYSRALNDLLRLRKSNPAARDKKDEKRTQSQDRIPATYRQSPLLDTQHELNSPLRQSPMPPTVGKLDPAAQGIAPRQARMPAPLA